MAGFLDSTYETSLTSLPNNHGTQTLAFVKNVLKGLLYASLGVSTRTVTGQVKYGDGTNYSGVISVNIQCDQVITVNTGTLVTTAATSVQINTNSSGVFQVTIAGTQGATVVVTVSSGVSTLVVVGSGGAGGGGGGGGISGVTVKDEGSTVTGGPHTTINFVGSAISAADAGGGQVNVTVSATGGVTDWVAGSYSQGSVVKRGPYLWRANTTTSEDPFLIEGNLGLNTDWTFQAFGSAGTTQTPGASDGAPNGKILLINNGFSSSVAVYRQSVNSGVFGKWLIVDLQISGTADLVMWGFYDSSLAQTAVTLAGLTGFYGIELDIYDPSTSEISARANGARVGSTQSYSNANMTNAGSGFSRWYAKFTQNGSNWDVELYRPARTTGTFPFSGFNANQEDELALIFRQTNIAAPSYTNWRFVMGSNTGGASMVSSCRAAYVRNFASGAWTCIGKVPTQLL